MVVKHSFLFGFLEIRKNKSLVPWCQMSERQNVKSNSSKQSRLVWWRLIRKALYVATLLTTNFPNTISLYKLFTSLAFYTPWSAASIHHDRDAYATVLI